VNKVPIGRYLAFVGSLLLAMLFIADWLLPIGPTQSVTSGEAGKATIRIKSDHKWPEAALPLDGLSTGCKSRSVTRWLVVR
jgi:hypothetical protein